jgi:hypothetical protein
MDRKEACMARAGRLRVVIGVGLVVAFVALALGLGAVGHAQTSEWSVPVNLGKGINTRFAEDLPHIAGSGRSLYFISNRPGFGSFDIWVSQRETRDDPWGPPMNVGANINTSFNERGPCLSPDGHYLFFSSDRTDGGLGSQDLWRSYRDDTSDDFGWQAPENLGRAVNTSDPDFGAAFLGGPHETFSALLFGRRESFEDADIYMSAIRADGSFARGVVVTELSTSYDDLRPTIRRDGLELFFNSNRPVARRSRLNDLWVSTRPSVNSPWSTPVNVGPAINTEFEERFPALSGDGSTLVFSSNRPGSIDGSDDLYGSRRESAFDPWPWY